MFMVDSTHLCFTAARLQAEIRPSVTCSLLDTQNIPVVHLIIKY